MSKLLERLDELYLRKPTKRGELQYDRYQRLASALVDAYPKLRAVVEAAEKLSETCRDILPGGSAEAIGDFYGDTYELADALAALAKSHNAQLDYIKKLERVAEVAHRLAVDFDRADLGKARFFDPEEEVLVGELNVALAALEEDV